MKKTLLFIALVSIAGAGLASSYELYTGNGTYFAPQQSQPLKANKAYQLSMESPYTATACLIDTADPSGSIFKTANSSAIPCHYTGYNGVSFIDGQTVTIKPSKDLNAYFVVTYKKSQDQGYSFDLNINQS